MYNIENSKISKNDWKLRNSIQSKNDLCLIDDQKLSYRRLSNALSIKYKFTKKQMELFRREDIFRWSVTVSDKSTNPSEFRLLAISCISLKSMENYKNKSEKIHLTEISNHGFTFVFTITRDRNDYLVRDIDDKGLPINYGGIVKLFSKEDCITNQKTEQKMDKSQNSNEHILILLTLSGIYKYYMNNKSINYIQKLKYPKRIYNSIINRLNFTVSFANSQRGLEKLYHEELNYLKYCLSKHYFLVDTMKEDIRYIELYNLKTNQLVNTFQRPISFKSVLFDLPSSYAVSNNNKLLAYFSLSIKGIKIYSVECGLEIAELVNIVDFLEIDSSDILGLIIDFFHNDEMLFVYSSNANEWLVWNIFGTLREPVKLKRANLDLRYGQIERSNSFIIFNKDEDNKPTIYDELIIDKYLKGLKKKSGEYYQAQESKELNDYYYNIEPWLRPFHDLDDLHDSYYLDEKKERLLLVGSHTIQVWYVRKRSLEFIHVPSSHLPSFSMPNLLDGENERDKIINVSNVKCCNGKFKLTVETNEEIEYEIKMEDEDDIINLAKHACYALKYLNGYKKFEQFYAKDYKSKFYDIIEQTRKLILRFIRLRPNIWLLLDIRFGLMKVLIEAEDYELVNDILSYKKLIHIPQYISWTGGKNTIRTALSDPIMLALFLEYYSNNAIKNIGWMNTVVDIIPELYKSDEKKDETEKIKSYAYYAQKLFYNHCFCDKQLDLFSFEFLEISPKSNDLLKVFIPITQLIPQDSKLKLQEIDYNKIADIRMVPLTDFTTNRISSNIRQKKFTNFLKFLILPSLYLSSKEQENYSPFIKLINKGERDILFENPSMGAVMNWMWYSCKSYWIRSLYFYFLYFLTYSIIIWAYISQLQVAGTLLHFLIIITIVLFYYLSYYHLAIEFNQFCRKKRKYFTDLFNWVDLSSLFIPIFVFSYILINSYTIENGFKDAKSDQNLAFIIFLSILLLWYQFILLLRILEGFAQYLNILFNIVVEIRQFLLFFVLTIVAMGHALFILLGYPNNVGLSQSPPTYTLTNGSAAYTMIGDQPVNPFANPINSILQVYYWSQISFSGWNFWPLTILSVIGSFIFVIILQNVIISFMGNAFSEAYADSKPGVYRYQIDLILDFALLKESLEFNHLDSKFKDKLRARYICFYDEPSITKSWNEESEKMISKPYPNVPILRKSGFESWPTENCKFIWEKTVEEKTEEDEINYWFLGD
ncbi:transient receptor potential channel pyrexia-like [Gigaspora margarita]|nr:transient receptor potential channel pyrexia-like [Gigaspora margarita]